MSPLPETYISSETTFMPAVLAWEYYLQDQGRSRFTLKAFVGDLNLFASFFAPDVTVGSVTEKDINRFLDWLQKERGIPCSPKSLSRRITSIKSFFRWLTQSGKLPFDPAAKVLQQSVISPLPQVLSPEEELKVIQAAMAQRVSSKKDSRSYTLVTLLLSTGIKKGECLALKLNHLNLDNPLNAYLYVRYASNTNRYKERKLNLTQDWVEVFQEYADQYAPSDQVFPWSPRRLEYLLEDLGNQAGLEKHLSFDMCRWTSALNDWQSGMDRDALRINLGISKIQWREISMKLRQLAGELPG